MKAKEWNFGNSYVYLAGIADWTKKQPQLAMFLDQPLAENQGTFRQLQKEYKKHTLKTADFLRLSRKGDTLVCDVREMSNRDQFPVSLANLRHYPVDRMVKLIKSGSRKVKRKKLLIFDNCGKQSLWLEHVLRQTGHDNYHFLDGGVLSWQKDGYDPLGRRY
ncbi:MAG: rhodanese-like domain-containing protein [Thermodesulfobacteriota bacterium]